MGRTWTSVDVVLDLDGRNGPSLITVVWKRHNCREGSVGRTMSGRQLEDNVSRRTVHV